MPLSLTNSLYLALLVLFYMHIEIDQNIVTAFLINQSYHQGVQ
jgi:hypothetical protein